MSEKQTTYGLKHDQGKQSFYFMPLAMLEPLADVFLAGVKKGYPPFNCLLPFQDGDRRLYDAMMRHAAASQIDPLSINHEDGGVFNLAQVAFCALTRLHNALNARAGTPEWLAAQIAEQRKKTP